MNDERIIKRIEEELEKVRLEFNKKKLSELNKEKISKTFRSVLLAHLDAGRILYGNVIDVKIEIENGSYKVTYPNWVYTKKFV